MCTQRALQVSLIFSRGGEESQRPGTKHRVIPIIYGIDLTRLEKKNGDLTKVEVDEVLGLVGDVRTEVTADNAVPGGLVLSVELTLDIASNLTLNAVLSLYRGDTT
jgi:hypothetical protein